MISPSDDDDRVWDRAESPAQGIERSGAALPRRFVEPLARTLRRTFTICFVLTTIFSLAVPTDRSRLLVWFTTFPAILWFPLGGHFVELAYLNFVRLRIRHPLSRSRMVRVLVWFVGGLPLGAGALFTWTVLGNRPAIPIPWWWGMPFFVLAELVVHTILCAAHRPNFWTGND